MLFSPETTNELRIFLFSSYPDRLQNKFPVHLGGVRRLTNKDNENYTHLIFLSPAEESHLNLKGIAFG
jgi:hypothetical protein